MDPRLLSVHGISQARILGWVPFPSLRDLPDPVILLVSPALAGRFFTTEPPGKRGPTSGERRYLISPSASLSCRWYRCYKMYMCVRERGGGEREFNWIEWDNTCTTPVTERALHIVGAQQIVLFLNSQQCHLTLFGRCISIWYWRVFY